MTYQYRAFGLNIRSSIEMPELIAGSGEPGVTIRFGGVPEKLENPRKQNSRFQAVPDCLLLTAEDIARIMVSNGREIIVDIFPGVTEDRVRPFLLGSAVGALLHQRGLLPLHASSIRVNDSCILFCGRPGKGKSTIANALVNRGYELHTDDICVVSANGEGKPRVYAGYPQLKLWKDTLEKINGNTGPYRPLGQFADKFAVPAAHSFNTKPLPLGKIYILTLHDKHSIDMSPVTGIDKFKALKHQTYRRGYAKGLGTEDTQFEIIGKIANLAPINKVRRPKKLFLLDQLADVLEKDFGNVENV